MISMKKSSGQKGNKQLAIAADSPFFEMQTTIRTRFLSREANRKQHMLFLFERNGRVQL